MAIEGVILAAGLSSRAGTYKLTLALNGKTVIERCIDGMYDTCSKIIVVGGYNIEKLAPILDKYSKIKLIYNENYSTGMFSSVINGLKQTEGDRIFIIPGDYPLVSNNTYKKLLGINDDIVIPAYKGITGHPVLMNRETINLLLSATGIGSLREFICKHGFTALEVSCPGILIDIDTAEDCAAVQNYFKHFYGKVMHDPYSHRRHWQR